MVVRVFWRELAEAGARRGEWQWQLLDGVRLGTRIVGSGSLSCALLIDVWARQCRRQQSQALCEVVLRMFWKIWERKRRLLGLFIRVGGRGKKSPLPLSPALPPSAPPTSTNTLSRIPSYPHHLSPCAPSSSSSSPRAPFRPLPSAPSWLSYFPSQVYYYYGKTLRFARTRNWEN